MRYTPARAYLYKDRSSAILTLCTTSSWFKSCPPWSRKPQGVSNESLKSRTSIALFCSIFKLPSCKNIRFIYHGISFHLQAKPRRQDASWNATYANRMQGKVVNTAIRKINGKISAKKRRRNGVCVFGYMQHWCLLRRTKCFLRNIIRILYEYEMIIIHKTALIFCFVLLTFEFIKYARNVVKRRVCSIVYHYLSIIGMIKQTAFDIYLVLHILSFSGTQSISIFLEWKWSFLGKYSNKGGVDGWGGCKFKVLLSLSDAIAKGFCA